MSTNSNGILRKVTMNKPVAVTDINVPNKDNVIKNNNIRNSSSTNNIVLDSIYCMPIINNEALYQLQKLHSCNKLELSIKTQLSQVIQLITNKNTSTSQIILQILNIYNITIINKSDHIFSLEELLLSDYTKLNSSYLFTLKLVSLQLILQRKLHLSPQDNLQIQPSILLTILANDKRYLIFQNTIPNAKNLIKLLFHFYSVPNTSLLLKFYFGVKILQYLLDYNLDIKNFIKHLSIKDFLSLLSTILKKEFKTNIPKTPFKRQLSSSNNFTSSINTNTNIRSFLNPFVIQLYSSIKNTDQNDLELLEIIENKIFITIYDKDVTNSNYSLNQITSLIDSTFVDITNGTSSNHWKSINLIFNTWNILLSNNFINFNSQLLKLHLKLFDNNLVFINQNIDQFLIIDENLTVESQKINFNLLLTLLINLKDFLLLIKNIPSTNSSSSNQYQLANKRLSNLISVSFNCFTILKDLQFFNFAIDLELFRFAHLKAINLNDIDEFFSNFKKFLNSIENDSFKLKIINYKIFNSLFLLSIFNFTLNSLNSLTNLIYFISKLKANCLSNNLTKLIIDGEEDNVYLKHFKSDLMICILLSNSNIKPTEQIYNSWSIQLKILYHTLCNTNIMIPIPTTTTIFNFDKNDYLYNYRQLIKTTYYLNVEMEKHSTLNLSAITNSLLEHWFSLEDLNNDPSIRLINLEINLIKMLISYLSFNNFDKLVLKVISIIESIPRYSKKNTKSNVILFLNYYRLNSLINLKLFDQIDIFFNITSPLQLSIDSISIKDENFSSISISNNILHLKIILLYISHYNDSKLFQSIFIENLPNNNPHLIQTNNSLKLNNNKYTDILLFNIQLYSTSSKIHLNNNNILESIVESNRCLKLSIGLLKHKDILQQIQRLDLIKSIISSYLNMIHCQIHIGSGKDTDFYIKELLKLVNSLKDPTPVFVALCEVFNFYKLTDQLNMKDLIIEKINQTFKFLDSKNNICSIINYMYINGFDHSKIFNCISTFFNNSNETFLIKYWSLKLGKSVNLLDNSSISNNSPLEKHQNINTINKINELYKKIENQLETDTHFRNLFDSVLITPSCSYPVSSKILPHNLMNNKNQSLTTPKRKIINSSLPYSYTPNCNSIFLDSPRSSSMTPRGKNKRQEFDKSSALNNLNQINLLVKKLDLNSLKNYELNEIACLYSLSVSLISSITISSIPPHVQNRMDCLYELSRYMPMYYDKILSSSIKKSLYTDISPLPMKNMGQFVTNIENQFIKNISNNTTIMNESSALPKYSIIALDICPITGHLIISKSFSYNNKKLHIRISLDRARSRDLDANSISFKQFKNELDTIIKLNNDTTSLSVTSKIKTKEDRKSWWKQRHDLDKKLQDLLLQLEITWLSGLKGIFDDTIIDEKYFNEFKLKFNNILQQSLPTRKQFGTPSNFVQIEDWIIELFLKLDISDHDFYSAMEDLIYLVLDILLFHGEENAYDEIDMNVLHIAIEEQIKKYHSAIIQQEKYAHTFLIVSSACHSIPWENIPILKNKPISRIPSYQVLFDTLHLNSENIFTEISLDSNISIILNPHGDLMGTESRFIDDFNEIVEHRSSSYVLVRRKPDEAQFIRMISNSNLFLYIGHGGGEQFVHAKEIKKLNSVAPSLLLGCSSASMKYYGKLEPTGIIYSYLLGGSPMVIGNLWDVTDKDIDRFSKDLFERIGLFPSNNKSTGPSENVCYPISEAITNSRRECHLRYLNGCAPIIYGIPLIFRKSSNKKENFSIS
ncbi:hypothetical protein TBLA_0C02250 [Henningerozyma blattae CBS 6284]|uniref:separase n=1 Tax=Henningerozyma blattae (strain ATCC 34711 / CBS 6284 / DSM 70876 / NBRC 10599 / NRRL Y-10934 / UCD 77-7) TaxID=1071380 RepID=I2H0Y5_HENB6|nr:hypothetical protein TBLA_0C02250 [Tetrapisispora blattae CBS 6284]CCH60037.1 hypothetical protein TBLA_0C02250 [Tetrapisispora blattae CBS 6284]